jgi:hypothetical protein
MKKSTFPSIVLLGTLFMLACIKLVSQDSKSDLRQLTTLTLADNVKTEITDVIDFSASINSGEKPVANATSEFLVNELNTSTQAQSYPWLSDDALRVYYTHGTLIYMASRSDVNAKFRIGNPVFPDLKETAISGWLSSDEHGIYIATQSGKLFKATRNTSNENFSTYAEVKLINAPGGSLFDASFTPDMEELMMYNNDGKERIVKFIRTAENEYKFAGEVNVLSMETPTGGQLSRDGLRYFIPFKRSVNGNNDYRNIYVLSRKNMHDDFDNIGQVKTINEINISAYQPSINADETQMMFVTGTENLWDNNDLCSVGLVKEVTVPASAKVIVGPMPIVNANTKVQTKSEKTSETILIGNPVLVEMHIAPNPFNERTQIEIVVPEGGYLLVEAYSMDGQLVATLYNGDCAKGVNIIAWIRNALSNGIYIIKATVGKTTVTKKVVACGTH